jgi:polysaccharide biosynthesis transport protein
MLLTLVAVLAVGAICTLKQKKVYESTALMLLASPRATSFTNDETGILSDLASLTRSRTVQSELDILMSADVFQDAAEELGEEAVFKGFGSDRLPAWAVSLDTKKDSDVITIKAKAYDPRVAAALANALVHAGIQNEQGYNSLAAKASKDSVGIERDRVRNELITAQKQLAQYKRQTKLVVPDSQLAQIAGNMLSLQMEKDKYDVERAAMLRQREALKRQLADDGKTVESSQSIQTNPEYLAAQSALGQLQAQRAILLQKYTPQAREIKNIDGAIAETKSRMKTIATTVVGQTIQSRNPVVDKYVEAVVNESSASARVGAINGVLSQRNREIQALPDQERNMTMLMQNVESLDRTFQMLSDKYNTLSISERSTFPAARLASTARPSWIPASPNKARNAGLFLILGLMLAAAVAAVAERLDRRLHDEDAVVHATGETALAVIPDEKSLRKTPLSEISHNTPFIEAFRILRNVTLFSDDHRDVKLLAVTSPGGSEGKSTTCVNLARAIAMLGKRVLLVDCDLRRPSLHNYLGISGKAGFTDLVKGLLNSEEAVQPTKLENVFCLTSGPLPPDSAEFLNSMDSRSILKALAQEYDAVILDCPPCAGLSDMQVISTIVQGVLLVVTMNKTMQTSLNRAIASLTQVGAPVMGYVINRLNAKRSGYDYYQYYSDAQPRKRWGFRSRRD